MDSNSSAASGETLNIKTRKPYTITKQRERWTEDEHNRFLEALKLYGRAWQRIEEHIGTKTAVQIRSHAQKFFTKLEKEAVAKGIPIGQAVDMEIPPPRPKRKPNYPYPRKTDPKTHTQPAQKDEKQATTLVSSLKLLDLEAKPLSEKTSHNEKLDNEKTDEEILTGTTEDPQEARNESYITIETQKHQELDQDGVKHTNITSNISLSDIQGVRTCPRHVPVQVVDVNQGIMAKTSGPTETSLHESNVNNLGEVFEHPNPNQSAGSETSGHRNSATFHPLFNPVSDNHESYRSFLHFSSAIPGPIVSSLLQNPTAHAAASFAAKFWHPVTTEASSADSYSRDQLNAETVTPSMAAIAAATVAAATAWWSAIGLLPVCTPFYQGGYSGTFGMPGDGNLADGQDKAPSECALQEEKMDAEKTESAADAADLSSSEDSEKKLASEVSPVDIKETVPVADSSKLTNGGKQVDRSSCGSNTTSSSEIETSVLEKHGKETEETQALDAKEPVSRRGRSTIMPNESWKEVSEEGRLAFQALFSREVLPQSFSDTHTVAEKDQLNMVNNSELDLNRTSQEPVERYSNGFAVTRLGSVKLNHHHRTGFKPYKRCSIEAKESSKIASAAASTANQNDEKGPKRMRVAAEAST
ncbi:putative transcription factor MYB-HB-like family [Helianthus annuus]|nr:putative transcription factor MYB-HB-like family [Helianthus annuus]